LQKNHDGEVEFVRSIIAVIIIGILLFGCISMPTIGKPANVTTNKSQVITQNQTPVVTQNTTQPIQTKSCSDSYAFSQLSNSTLSKSATFAMTATCASGKKIAVYTDDVKIGEKIVATDAATALSFGLVAAKDGKSKIEVKANDALVHTAEWITAPIGHLDTNGLAIDPVSIKQWRAIAFDVDNTIIANTVSMYMKRIEYNLMNDTEILIELRSDNNGNPGDGVLTNSRLNIAKTTMTNNWINFALSKPITLTSGKYWLVVKMTHPTSPLVSDVVNIHYTSKGNSNPANDYHRQMDLRRNVKTDTWEQTSWEPLTYDRWYTFRVSAN
jgi:hypothetical protein